MQFYFSSSNWLPHALHFSMIALNNMVCYKNQIISVLYVKFMQPWQARDFSNCRLQKPIKKKNNFLYCLPKSKTKFYSRPCIVWLRRGSKVWTFYIALITSLKPWGFSILINMRSAYNSIIPVCPIFFRGSPIFVGLRCMNNTSGYFGSPIPKKR